MLEITETALKELNAFFEGKDKQSIRIYLAPGGWRGPRLALALDEPLEDDTVIEQDGFTFCVNETLLKDSEGMQLDVTYMGFVIEPKKPFANAGSDCGSCGSSCS